MDESREILKWHEVNIKRISNAQKPANSIWLWGQGKAPSLPSFYEEYHLMGAVISGKIKKKGLSKKVAKEFLKESKGKKLPEEAPKQKARRKALDKLRKGKK